MKKVLARTLALAAVTGGITVVGPAQVARADTCLDSGYSVTWYAIGNGQHSTGTLITTSRCNDINIRRTNTEPYRYFRVCFVRTNACNSWKLVAPNTWDEIAYGVLDGSRFWIESKAPGLNIRPVAKVAA